MYIEKQNNEGNKLKLRISPFFVIAVSSFVSIILGYFD